MQEVTGSNPVPPTISPYENRRLSVFHPTENTGSRRSIRHTKPSQRQSWISGSQFTLGCRLGRSVKAALVPSYKWAS